MLEFDLNLEGEDRAGPEPEKSRFNSTAGRGAAIISFSKIIQQSGNTAPSFFGIRPPEAVKMKSRACPSVVSGWAFFRKTVGFKVYGYEAGIPGRSGWFSLRDNRHPPFLGPQVIAPSRDACI